MASSEGLPVCSSPAHSADDAEPTDPGGSAGEAGRSERLPVRLHGEVSAELLHLGHERITTEAKCPQPNSRRVEGFEDHSALQLETVNEACLVSSGGRLQILRRTCSSVDSSSGSVPQVCAKLSHEGSFVEFVTPKFPGFAALQKSFWTIRE